MARRAWDTPGRPPVILPPPSSGHGVPIDDLRSLLNPVHQADLAHILWITPEHRRVDVALAFMGLSQRRWADEAGLERNSLLRWMRKEYRLPLGVAFRLAKVIGVDVDLLFADYL